MFFNVRHDHAWLNTFGSIYFVLDVVFYYGYLTLKVKWSDAVIINHTVKLRPRMQVFSFSIKCLYRVHYVHAFTFEY